MKRALCLILIFSLLWGIAGCTQAEPPETEPPETLHRHSYTAQVTPPTCAEGGFTRYTCPCGDSYTDAILDATGDHTYENGTCTHCGAADPGVDLFVFAGQSNMMGAAALPPQQDTFTDKSWEYKYLPRLRGGDRGEFVPPQHPAGEFHYKDLARAYGDQLADLSYRSTLIDYSVNTWFCPSLRDGLRAYTMQSEASMDPAPSLPPYFVTEYASYGHASVYAHMAMGAAKIDYYFTEEMALRYNQLISAYNPENGTDYPTLSDSAISGAGSAFDEKFGAMVEDFALFAPELQIRNKCFLWLQGESDWNSSCIEYKLKLRVLWEHLKDLGFTHFFILRVGYFGNQGIRNVIKAQEEFCAESENCYIVTRAPSLIPFPGATTENWSIEPPDPEYDLCRDSYLTGRDNYHFNEKAMALFAKRSAENVHRILHLGQEPLLEEENIRF